MIGTVLSGLKMEKTIPGCQGYRWIAAKAQEKTVEAVDLVGCKEGQRVLILPGAEARCLEMGCPGEYAAVAVFAEAGNNG